MIDHLRAMAIFQSVAELGSFRKAAQRLKLSPSVVSHHIAQLEEHLGLPLLYRSTRRMSLTDAGVDLLAASQRMSAAAQEGLDAINRRIAQPVGKLSITTNASMAHRPFSDLYAGFARAYPKVQLSIHITDETLPLEGSEYDVAIRGRVTDLDDSSYKIRKLRSLEFCIFASPDYVRGRPPLNDIDDLADWDRIAYPAIPWASIASTAEGKGPSRTPRSLLSCDNYAMARTFVEDGLGFMIETYPLVAKDIQAGRLVQLLPKVRLRPVDVFAVYPANSTRDSLARVFVDYLLSQQWA
ncbi:MAG: LysR family transcriptional regulator [Rhizobiaceae bacterium]|uniref:LysR family transcriptional regulator n=1 Tax=Marivita sp. TaxID=2003365 RepID=UPI0026288A59|nr:LysR family transcriptional regulator [Marivita sp.]